jgi:hypothetical protein
MEERGDGLVKPKCDAAGTSAVDVLQSIKHCQICGCDISHMRQYHKVKRDRVGTLASELFDCPRRLSRVSTAPRDRLSGEPEYQSGCAC